MTRNDMVNGWLAMREVSRIVFDNRGFAPIAFESLGEKTRRNRWGGGGLSVDLSPSES